MNDTEYLAIYKALKDFKSIDDMKLIIDALSVTHELSIMTNFIDKMNGYDSVGVKAILDYFKKRLNINTKSVRELVEKHEELQILIKKRDHSRKWK